MIWICVFSSSFEASRSMCLASSLLLLRLFSNCFSLILLRCTMLEAFKHDEKRNEQPPHTDTHTDQSCQRIDQFSRLSMYSEFFCLSHSISLHITDVFCASGLSSSWLRVCVFSFPRLGVRVYLHCLLEDGLTKEDKASVYCSSIFFDGEQEAGEFIYFDLHVKRNNRWRICTTSMKIDSLLNTPEETEWERETTNVTGFFVSTIIMLGLRLTNADRCLLPDCYCFLDRVSIHTSSVILLLSCWYMALITSTDCRQRTSTDVNQKDRPTDR